MYMYVRARLGGILCIHIDTGNSSTFSVIRLKQARFSAAGLRAASSPRDMSNFIPSNDDVYLIKITTCGLKNLSPY
jgi:hypothetical protein